MRWQSVTFTLLALAFGFAGVTACSGGADPEPDVTPTATEAPEPISTPVPTLEPTETLEPTPTATQEPTRTPPGGEPGEGRHVVLDLVAENTRWDVDTLEVSLGAETVTVRMENRDAGIPHSFAVYTDETAAEVVFRGDFFTGPGTVEYTFDAPSPGTYFFRCDVHPDAQTGAFVVR